jgi:hypothetical protein
MQFTAEIKNDLAALSVLKDWLGDGMKPVESPLAKARAKICLSCPMNHGGNWWDAVKSDLADEIRKQIAIKHQLKLKTDYDGFLGTCKVCSCNLRLKVWTPIEHIKSNMPEETMNAFPAHCWIPQRL